MKNFLATACTVVLLAACKCGHKVASTSGVSGNVVTPNATADLNYDNLALTDELQNKVGDRVFFAFDKSGLSAEAKATLDNQAEFINTNSNLKFTVEGYCDERGTVEYNLALGERRANSAKHYLESKGIDNSRLSTVSYGKDKPAVIGHDEEAWRQNRRAVTVISGQ